MDDQLQPASPATPGATTPLNYNSDTTDSGVAGDATVAEVSAALAHNLKYTLTAGEALQRFADLKRKVPSLRSIQRYCGDQAIAAEKIRTTYGSEWLLNEASLDTFIRAQPVVELGDAGVANLADTLAPPLNIAPATNDNGDAGVAMTIPVSVREGERRSLAEVLMENARLLATLEGKQELIVEIERRTADTIAELRDDRGFLREEVREARQQRGDIKEIANRMLETLENMAVGGKLLRGSTPENTQPVEIVRRVYQPEREDQR